MNSADLPKGLQRVTALPQPELAELWSSIVVDADVKDRLVSQAVELHGQAQGRAHGSVACMEPSCWWGPPGTGKTSLARGLANELATLMKKASFTLLEVDPHALSSSMMGKTQKAVSDLFAQTIVEAAIKGPTIVLLDEVETLAADRTKLSLEANPVDAHSRHRCSPCPAGCPGRSPPQAAVYRDQQFPQAVDSFHRRAATWCSMVPLPNLDACRQTHGLSDWFGETFNGIQKLPNAPGFEHVVKELVGLTAGPSARLSLTR